MLIKTLNTELKNTELNIPSANGELAPGAADVRAEHDGVVLLLVAPSTADGK